MASFEKIIQWILFQEDDHKLPGKIVDLGDGVGSTRLGLTQRWHLNDVSADFFSSMSFKDAVAAAKPVYRKAYWNPIQGDSIQADIVAAPLMSFAVNASSHLAVKTLQAVLGVPEDGALGPNTLAELNSKDPEIVTRLFRLQWADFYTRDVQLNPDKAKFLKGWISRSCFPYPSSLIPSIYQ